MNVDQSLKGQNRSKCVILYPNKDMDDIEIDYLLSTKVQKKFVKYATVYSIQGLNMTKIETHLN